MADKLLRFIQSYSWLFLVLFITAGWVFPFLMVLALICMIGPIVFSFCHGRAWCGNFCPRNSFSHVILRIISSHKKAPRMFTSTWMRFLAFMTLMALFITNIFIAPPTLMGLGLVFIKMMALTTIIQIVFGIVWSPHSWCMVCPMGSAAGFISTIRKNKIQGTVAFDGQCTACGDCDTVCPMQLTPSSYKEKGAITHPDCLKCRFCINTCRENVMIWTNQKVQG